MGFFSHKEQEKGIWGFVPVPSPLLPLLYLVARSTILFLVSFLATYLPLCMFLHVLND